MVMLLVSRSLVCSYSVMSDENSQADHTITDLLDRAARRALPLVRSVADTQLDDPTPCSEFAVRDLLNHVFQVVIGFRELAAGRPVDFRSAPDHLDGDWRSRFAEEVERLVEAWAAPGAEEGHSEAMGMPARTVGEIVLLDLTVHAWDLARATGQPYLPDEVAEPTLHALVAALRPRAAETSMKIFDEPVPVPEGASSFEVLLGATGRDPRWSRE